MEMKQLQSSSMVNVRQIRLYKLVILVIVVLLFTPLLTHYYLTRVGTENGKNSLPDDLTISPWITHQLVDVDKLEGQDLKYRIEELLRIKQSVLIELRDLEGKRQHLQLELTSQNRKLEDFKTEISRKRNELERLQISVQQAKVAEKEAMERNTPRLGRPKALHPLRFIPTVHEDVKLKGSVTSCLMDSCFDYSLCPLSSQFTFYLYPLNTIDGSTHSTKTESLYVSLSRSPYLVRDNNPLRACLFFLVLEDCSLDAIRRLESLPNWFGDGRNHVIWLQCSESDKEFSEFFLHEDDLIHFGRAMIVQQSVSSTASFRHGFDLVVNNWIKSIPSGEIWSQLPPIVPAKRKYLSTYLGSETESSVQSDLLKIQQSDPTSFVFQFSCSSSSDHGKSKFENLKGNLDDDAIVISEELQKSAKNFETFTNKKLSSLCGNDQLRTRLLLDSTFTLLLLPPTDLDLRSSVHLQLRLYEALKYGTIPVVLGTRFLLPFSEVIDWSKIVITLPVSRISELHYLLKSFTDSDILQFKKSGRFVFENYFGTIDKVVQTVLATFRTRIGLPPLPFKEIHLPSGFNETFTPLKLEAFSIDPEDEENLGPIEPPYPSPTFVRNYSTTSIQKYELWNTYFQPFNLYPFTPWEELMPSDAKFVGSSVGFRPIGSGAGGSGKEFSESLGGNLPKEQFTVVMLTYEREMVLMNSIQRLFALPYLNKVIIVWNSPQGPSVDLKWPDIGVPVQILKAEKNSLNNRFLPFDAIETEAVLSIDDDAHLRHDEIVFGFRVWRENRDRIVGFPGRFHAHDLNHGGWLYNSNYSCELSMVLTGAAFYHKIYSYLYTYEMPEAIRNKVDELMNCEDIAMNFLVSHMTRKPPVKVTSRWTFRCPGCPVTLSEDDTHFQERHHCINFFTKVFGYTPLLNTQFRADSVLFKTRIPHDKQKCFKYI